MVGELAPGERFEGFRVLGLLSRGRGGGSAVYLAEPEAADGAGSREVVLRVFDPGGDLDDRRRHLDAYRAAAGVAHPHLVRILTVGVGDDRLYVAMARLDGPDLRTVLRDGALDADQIGALLTRVAGALDAMHAVGVAHGGVRPSGILGTGILVEPDLRVGREVPVDHLAPERIEGAPPTAAADIYGLGCVLYHCLAGRPPFVGDTWTRIVFSHLTGERPAPLALPGDLGPRLDRVIARAMARSPAARFRTAGELAAAYGRAVRGEDGPTASASSPAAAAMEVEMPSGPVGAGAATPGFEREPASCGRGLGPPPMVPPGQEPPPPATPPGPVRSEPAHGVRPAARATTTAPAPAATTLPAPAAPAVPAATATARVPAAGPPASRRRLRWPRRGHRP